MTDEEIKTKRLTDWKPETDIKLQKAFGKFVEEAGELLDEVSDYCDNTDRTEESLENELADCKAVLTMIDVASNHAMGLSKFNFSEADLKKYKEQTISASDISTILSQNIARMLKIVGRCQVQGIKGSDPETGVSNTFELAIATSHLLTALDYTIRYHHLDEKRINARMQAKIDSKLPWVMGTATDLLPDQSSCEHNWRYTGTDPRGSHKGEDHYECTRCPATKYEM